jgi:hypothetical protein
VRFSTVRSHETVEESVPVDPVDMVPLSALVVEGFGWGGLVASPLDAIAVLAGQLEGEVVLDDLGRRCVSREVARGLFAARAEAEVKAREVRERLEAEYLERAAANPVWTGIPADRVPDGVWAAAAMLQAAKDEQPRRRSVLEHALTNDGSIEYHPVGPVPE